MIDERIYLDNASSTRLDERVMEAIKPYLYEKYAVATSDFGHTMGVDAKEGLESARETIASKLGADVSEIVFTSGNAESSNLALKGVMGAVENKGHLIISAIEDFPVLHTAKKLEKQGHELTILSVDKDGFISLSDLKDEIKENTALVSIQHGNQEIGTLQNIPEIGKLCADEGVLFHTDATHTFTRVPIDVKYVDLITISAHTIHGPKGIGALYVSDGVKLEKQMEGGFQEKGRRGGLENIPGAVGFARAVELVDEEENERLKEMRDHLIERIQEEIPDTTLNGSREKRIPQNANITFHYVEGESITLHMDMRGVAVSTGSACFSASLEASHVILGIGGDHERAHGSVRFSLGRFNTMEEMDHTVEHMKEIVGRLREISPLGKEVKK